MKRQNITVRVKARNITKEITQAFKPRVNACKDAGGRILTETEHIQRRWKEYFESVLPGNLNDTDSMTFYTVEN